MSKKKKQKKWHKARSQASYIHALALGIAADGELLYEKTTELCEYLKKVLPYAYEKEAS